VTAGGSRWDVWYDADHRLVKRTWSRDGRTVVAELKARK
jgi:YD repeat-containing protein